MFLWGLGAVVELEVLVTTSQKLDVHDHKLLVCMFSKFEEDRILGMLFERQVERVLFVVAIKLPC